MHEIVQLNKEIFEKREKFPKRRLDSKFKIRLKLIGK